MWEQRKSPHKLGTAHEKLQNGHNDKNSKGGVKVKSQDVKELSKTAKEKSTKILRQIYLRLNY